MSGLFSFRGRMSRLRYWRTQLLAGVSAALFWLLGLFAMLSVGPIGGLLFAPLLPIAVIMAAAWLRRLHDRGKSAWWTLLFLVLPLGLEGVAQSLAEANTPASALAGLPFSLAGIGISIWAFVELGFLRGQPATNRFGDPPTT